MLNHKTDTMPPEQKQKITEITELAAELSPQEQEMLFYLLHGMSLAGGRAKPSEQRAAGM